MQERVEVAAPASRAKGASNERAVRRAGASGTAQVSARVLEEVVAVAALAAALFVMVSLVSYQRGAGDDNLGGPVGYALADAVLQSLGLAAYLVPVLLAVIAVGLLRQPSRVLSIGWGIGGLAIILDVAVAFGLVAPEHEVALAGGWLGGFIATVMRETFGAGGAFVLTVASLLVLSVFTTGVSLQSAAGTAYSVLRRGLGAGARLIAALPARGGPRVGHRPSAGHNLEHELPVPHSGPVIVLHDELEVPAEEAAGTKAVERPARPIVQELFHFAAEGNYQRPTSALLDPPQRNTTAIDEEALRKGSQILETKLADFAIQGKVTAVRPGPVITTFEIEPAPGVKVNRIVTLGDDLAMALRAVGVRILAPVPGTAVVGIEVANSRREQISLGELIDSALFRASASPLTLALGKDTAGNPTIADLARMPHLLIAGATGTGKSVSLNAMVMSILQKASPREVRFIMIDLKMLELSVYEDIPHLLVPVVTDPKKAVAVLKNVAAQMDERYRLMKGVGVRNIDGYNRVVEREDQERKAGIIELNEVLGEDEDEIEKVATLHREHLPKIVIIIDELADLMLTMGRAVEDPINRLAQKARAAGIHLIVATQRPSVDVITGLIKANFPARMSFQVTARVDSRTILDHIGAERLLGGGDMLYLQPGTARVQRLHGPFVSEMEIHKTVDFIKRQSSPVYAFGLLESDEEEDEDGSGVEDELDDALYDQAVRLVTESRQASISWVQRRLRVGYNRAARMIERMEREGVISTSEGGRPREVIARRIDGDS